VIGEETPIIADRRYRTGSPWVPRPGSGHTLFRGLTVK